MLAEVREVGPVRVADVEEVAEHRDAVALLAVAEQLGDGDAERLAVQVEQRRLQRGDGVDGGAQVEGLQPAAAGVAVGEPVGDLAQQAPEAGHRLADEQVGGVLDRLPDRLPAGDLAEAGAAVGVGEDRDVAGELRTVGAGEVEQHRVVPGDGHDLDGLDGDRHSSSPSIRRRRPHGLSSRTASGSSSAGTSW